MIHWRLLLFVFILMLTGSRTHFAQNAGGGGTGAGGNGFGGGAGGTGAGGNGGNAQSSSGIKIDAHGVMSLIGTDSSAGSNDKKRRSALARKALPQDLSQKSSSRFVSLVTLEQQLAEKLARNEPIPNEMFFLAGLQRIDHLLIYPDERDLVISGPAEGFTPDTIGRMVGIETGRPALRLDDLFVALRTVPRSRQIGCSIDPVPQQLAELRKFILQGEAASIEVVEARFHQMDEILGLQDVRIDALPPDSHFATLLVEADYRMKLLAAGLELAPVKGLKSYLSVMGGKGNVMQRWWFVPAYTSLARSDDGLAFQFIGPRARLLTEEEVVDSQGNRSASATTQKSALAFAKLFSEKFPQLADKSPVFAELQNLIDWSVLAALLIHERIPERIGWQQELFLDASRLAHPHYDTPKKVPSQVSYKRVGNMVTGLVSGGVVIEPEQACDKSLSPAKVSHALDAVRITANKSTRNDAHRWWWDAE